MSEYLKSKLLQRNICIMFITIMLFACTSIEKNSKSYSELIVGIWAEFIDKDNNVRFYNTYFPDGRFHGYGYLGDDSDSFIYGDGTWEIIDNKNCITINYISDGYWEPGQHKWCDEIVELSSKYFKFLQADKVITMYRITNGIVKTNQNF